MKRKSTYPMWVVLVLYCSSLSLYAQASYELPQSQFKYMEERLISFATLPIKIDHVGIDTTTNFGGSFSIYLSGDMLDDKAIRDNVSFTFTVLNRSDINTISILPVKAENLYFTEKTKDGFYEYFFEPQYDKAKISNTRPLDLRVSISYPLGNTLKEHSFNDKPLVVIKEVDVRSRLIKFLKTGRLKINKTKTPQYFFFVQHSVNTFNIGGQDYLTALHVDQKQVNANTNVTDVSDKVIEKIWEVPAWKILRDLNSVFFTSQRLQYITSPLVAPTPPFLKSKTSATRVLVMGVYTGNSGYLVMYDANGKFMDARSMPKHFVVSKRFRLHMFSHDYNMLIGSTMSNYKLNIFIYDWKQKSAAYRDFISVPTPAGNIPQYYSNLSVTIDPPGRIVVNYTKPQNNIFINNYITQEYDLEGNLVWGMMAHPSNATSALKYHLKDQLPIYLINGYFENNGPIQTTMVPSSIYVTGRDEFISPTNPDGSKIDLYYPWLHDLKGTKATFYFVGLKPYKSRPNENGRNANYNEEVEAHKLTYDYETGLANVRPVQPVAGNHYSWYDLTSFTVLDKHSNTRGVLNICQQCIIDENTEILVERNSHLTSQNFVDEDNQIKIRFPSQAAFHKDNLLVLSSSLGYTSRLYYVNTSADEFIFDGTSLPFYEQSQVYDFSQNALNGIYSQAANLWPHSFYFLGISNTNRILSLDDKASHSEQVNQSVAATSVKTGIRTKTAVSKRDLNISTPLRLRFEGVLPQSDFAKMTFFIQNLDADGDQAHKIYPLKAKLNSTNIELSFENNTDLDALKNSIESVYNTTAKFTHADWAIVLDFDGKKSLIDYIVD